MSSPAKLTLENLDGGALSELVARAFTKIGENIADPNVPNEAVRKLKIIVKVKPDKKAQTAVMVYQVSTELPGAEPGQAMAHIAMDQQTKEITLFNADIRQEELFAERREPTVTEIRPVGEKPKVAPGPGPAQYAPPMQAD